jgi:hypothetical protein
MSCGGGGGVVFGGSNSLIMMLLLSCSGNILADMVSPPSKSMSSGELHSGSDLKIGFELLFGEQK